MPDAIDPTLDTWPITICNQIIQCLSITCACCLYLKPFLDSLESGLIRTDDRRCRGSNYKTSDLPTRRNVFLPDNQSRSQIRNMRMQEMYSPPYAAHIKGGYAAKTNDAESQQSRSHIIKKTRTFAVETSPNVEDNLGNKRIEDRLET